jgi:hypothetical protein
MMPCSARDGEFVDNYLQVVSYPNWETQQAVHGLKHETFLRPAILKPLISPVDLAPWFLGFIGVPESQLN